MAEQLSDLEQFAAFYTRCPVCQREFFDPRSLPACAHSVCFGCLGKIQQVTAECAILKCPVCARESRIAGAQGSLATLPTNPVLAGLLAYMHRRNHKPRKLHAACDASGGQPMASSAQQAEVMSPVDKDLAQLRNERNRINNVLQEFRSGYEDELF